MAKQSIGLGSTANDGSGDSLRVGGDKINDNFDEIYTTFGDGSTLTPFTTGTSTLTNKTINLTNNTLSGTLAQFNTALSDADFATLTGTETLTNKTLTNVGQTISRTGGDLILDVSGDMVIDADGGDLVLKDGGSIFGILTAHTGSSELSIRSGSTSAVVFTGANAAFQGNITAADLTLSGNLTVNGTTTSVATTNTTLADNMFELNSGASSNTNDIGIIMERGSTGDNAIFAWDESEDKFTIGTTTATADSTGNISITPGTLVANTFEGNLTGNVTGNVTGSAGSVTGNSATATQLANSRTIGMTGDVVWTSAAFDGTANVSGTATIQAASIERAMLEDGVVNSSKLASAVTLQILDSSGSTVKTIIGAGS